jgi:O-antigen/teichoic acid export membrane protein
VSNGKSGGAFGFALIFLLLFLSRKKVNKERPRQRKGHVSKGLLAYAFPFFACAKKGTKKAQPSR